MHSHGSKGSPGAGVPVVAIIAVVGAATLFFSWISKPKDEVQSSGINMITAASVDRAGATALPTKPTAQPNRPMQVQ